MHNDDPRDWLPSYEQFRMDQAEDEERNGIQWTLLFNEHALKAILFAYAVFSSGRPKAEAQALQFYVHEHSRLTELADSFRDVLTGHGAEYVEDELPDWLAAIAVVHEDRTLDIATFMEKCNSIFLGERISWVYQDGRLRRRGQQPLHLDVILPTESLLTSSPQFANAEKAYSDATDELAKGNFKASIMASQAAVHEVFRALGVQGETLGTLFAEAKKKGFLKAHDQKLLDAIHSLTAWLTADRSNRSNAHGHQEAERADAELALHISASVMLRLMQLGTDRDALPSQDVEPF